MVFFLLFIWTPLFNLLLIFFNMKKIFLLSFIFCVVAGKRIMAQSAPLNLASGSGTFYNISRTEGTKGSRYLFDTWAKGSVVDSKGNTIKNDSYGFNYDKINGALLLTQDKQTAVDVSKEQVKTFTVYDKLEQPITFEYVPAIDPTHFSQVLSAGAKYKVYKLTKTTFVKANYKSDGMTSSGNKYDEYTDEAAYYVFNIKTAQLQKVPLKNKAIKQVFADDVDKVKAFYSAHGDDEIDENFLKSLADSLN